MMLVDCASHHPHHCRYCSLLSCSTMATIYILFVDRLLQAACAAVFETATTADAIIDILSVVVNAAITRTPRTTPEHDPCMSMGWYGVHFVVFGRSWDLRLHFKTCTVLQNDQLFITSIRASDLRRLMGWFCGSAAVVGGSGMNSRRFASAAAAFCIVWELILEIPHQSATEECFGGSIVLHMHRISLRLSYVSTVCIQTVHKTHYTIIYFSCHWLE